MRFLRRLHLYLGVFFAPMLLFFVATGWYQTVTVNRAKAGGELGDWRSRLTQVHVEQIYPSEQAESYSPRLFRGLVVAMSVALIVTVLLGVWLAFRSVRHVLPVCLALGLGIAVPVMFLWLGQRTGPSARVEPGAGPAGAAGHLERAR